MSQSGSGSSGGIGFVGLLTCIFITLKLLGKIDWSWWWVLAAAWVFAALCIVLFILFLLFGDVRRSRW